MNTSSRFTPLLDPGFWSDCALWRVEKARLADEFFAMDPENQNDYMLGKTLDRLVFGDHAGRMSATRDDPNFLEYLFLASNKKIERAQITSDGSGSDLVATTHLGSVIKGSLWEWFTALAAAPDNDFYWHNTQHWFSGPLETSYRQVSLPQKKLVERLSKKPKSVCAAHTGQLAPLVLDFWEDEGFLNPKRFAARTLNQNGFDVLDGVLATAPRWGLDVIQKPYWSAWWMSAPTSARVNFVQSVLTHGSHLDKKDKKSLFSIICRSPMLDQEKTMETWRAFLTHPETRPLLQKRHLWPSLIACMEGSAQALGMGFHELARQSVLADQFASLVLGGSVPKIKQWSVFLTDDAWSKKVKKAITSNISRDLASSFWDVFRHQSHISSYDPQKIVERNQISLERLKVWVTQLQKENFFPKTLNPDRYCELIHQAVSVNRYEFEGFISPIENYLESCLILEQIGDETMAAKPAAKKPKKM